MRTILILALSVIAATAQELPKDKETPIVFRVAQVLDGGVLGTYYDAARHRAATKAFDQRMKRMDRAAHLAMVKDRLKPPQPEWTTRLYFLRVDSEGMADGEHWRGWVRADGKTYAYGSLTVKSLQAIRTAKD